MAQAGDSSRVVVVVAAPHRDIFRVVVADTVRIVSLAPRGVLTTLGGVRVAVGGARELSRGVGSVRGRAARPASRSRVGGARLDGARRVSRRRTPSRDVVVLRGAAPPRRPPERDFDVVVIGGGHAGAEAAAAAARRGARVALVTPSPLDTVGEMSCNPSIGGLAKGTLVREIDALDGLMGVAADRGGIQFRVLNASKGPAVRGPRAQMDRKLYKSALQSLLWAVPGVEVVDGAAADLIVGEWTPTPEKSREASTSTSASPFGPPGGVPAARVLGAKLADGTSARAPAVVITTGTFLRGVLHVGSKTILAGRMPTCVTASPDETAAKASDALADRMYGLGFRMGRLKTGTPPRLDGATIEWDGLEAQPGDEPPRPFGFVAASRPGSLDDGAGWMSSAWSPPASQVSCYATRTTAETEALFARSSSSSSASSSRRAGASGVPPAPRYCPSLETKFRRFPNRTHLVWLEPEGLDTDVVYPNGLSNSLEPDDQEETSHHPGLNARMLRPGHGVGPTRRPPRTRPTLETRVAVFSSGQINGTTGYGKPRGFTRGASTAVALKPRTPPRHLAARATSASWWTTSPARHRGTYQCSARGWSILSVDRITRTFDSPRRAPAGLVGRDARTPPRDARDSSTALRAFSRANAGEAWRAAGYVAAPAARHGRPISAADALASARAATAVARATVAPRTFARATGTGRLKVATRNSPGNSPSRRARFEASRRRTSRRSNPRRRSVITRRTSSGNEETWRICERTRRWRFRASWITTA